MKKKIKILIGIVVTIAFLYFSELYLLPFNYCCYNESKGIVTEVNTVSGAMVQNTEIKYSFTVQGKTYKNTDERTGTSFGIKENDTITVHYIAFNPNKNWIKIYKQK